jgi:hypothetical protein
MSTERDKNRIALSWLRADEHMSADRILDDVFAAVDTTPQRRPSFLARRTPTMNKFVTIGLAAAAVVVAAFLGYHVLFAPSVGGLPPAPHPSSAAPEPTPSSEPSQLPFDAAAWTEVTSAQYGFSAAHPPDWTYEPADHDWTVEAEAADTSQDVFMDPAGEIAVSVWSIPLGSSFDANDDLPYDRTYEDIEAWVEGYCRATGNEPCGTIPDQSVELCIEMADCHPALLVHFMDDVQAFLPWRGADGEIMIVAVWLADAAPAVAPYGGAQNLLVEFLTQMGDICPETNRERC